MSQDDIPWIIQEANRLIDDGEWGDGLCEAVAFATLSLVQAKIQEMIES